MEEELRKTLLYLLIALKEQGCLGTEKHIEYWKKNTPVEGTTDVKEITNYVFGKSNHDKI